jgi:hypothetical protein
MKYKDLMNQAQVLTYLLHHSKILCKNSILCSDIVLLSAEMRIGLTVFSAVGTTDD